MGLSSPTVVPCSALNVGVVAAIPGIEAQIKELGVDVSKLGASFGLQATVDLNSPNVAAFGGALAAHIQALPGAFAPDKWIEANASFSGGITADLGIAEANLQLVTAITARLEVGLNTGGIQAWTYSGGVAGLALAVTRATGRDARDVQGFVIACEDFDSWSGFSATFNTGRTVEQGKPLPTGSELTFLGGLTGGELNTGALQLKQPIDLYLGHLKGLTANLTLQEQVSLGINLPSVTPLIAQVEAALPQIELMLDNLVNVRIDPTAQISGINARADALLKLLGNLQVSLSAGGLVFWLYNGPASGLGPALAPTSSSGLPGGSGPGAAINGIIVLCANPQTFADFSLIFGGAA